MPTFNIYYGSSTDTAKKFASDTKEYLLGRNYQVKMLPCNKFDKQVFLKHRIIIIFCSNTGSGEAPKTATTWWDWFRAQRSGCMSKTRYAVFGLGSKAFTTFNRMGKQIDEQFKKVGAKEFAPLTLSDSSEGRHTTQFRAWLAQLGPRVEEVHASFKDVPSEVKKPAPAIKPQASGSPKIPIRLPSVYSHKRDTCGSTAAATEDDMSAQSEIIPELEVVNAHRGGWVEALSPTYFISGTGGSVVKDTIKARTIVIVVSNQDPLHDMLHVPPSRQSYSSGVASRESAAELRCVLVATNLELLAGAADQLRKRGIWKIVATMRGLLNEELGMRAADIVKEMDPLRVTMSLRGKPCSMPIHDDKMDRDVLRKVEILGVRNLCREERLKGIRLDVSEYDVAGTVKVRPRNHPHVVQYFTDKLLRVSAEMLDKIVITNLGDGDWDDCPEKLSLRDCLEEYVDLSCGITRGMMRVLKPFLTIGQRRILAEHESLLYGESEVDYQLSLKECFQLLGSPAVPVEAFLSASSPMQFRHYSIATSPKVSKLEFSLNLLEKELPDIEEYPNWNSQLRKNLYGAEDASSSQRVFEGMATHCLGKYSKKGNRVTLRFKTSAFDSVRLLLESPQPLPLLMMVGNGTGIATFIGITQEILLRERKKPKKLSIFCRAPEPKHSLVYGCRDSEYDWIYKDEMGHFDSTESIWGEEGVGRVYACFSRVGSSQIKYVQHQLEFGNAAPALEAMCQVEGSCMLVCGSPPMVIAVQKVVEHLREKYGDRVPRVLVEPF